MATKFAELDELFDDALELPVKGRDGTTRTYRIPSPSAETGLRIMRLTAVVTKLMAGGEPSTEILDDEEEHDLIAEALGPAEGEMRADGVDWAWRRHAGLTAVMWVLRGLDDARQFWATAGDPTRSAPANRAERRAAKSSGSATGSATKRRASSSGTSARPAGKTAAKASRA